MACGQVAEGEAESQPERNLTARWGCYSRHQARLLLTAALLSQAAQASTEEDDDEEQEEQEQEEEQEEEEEQQGGKSAEGGEPAEVGKEIVSRRILPFCLPA